MNDTEYEVGDKIFVVGSPFVAGDEIRGNTISVKTIIFANENIYLLEDERGHCSIRSRRPDVFDGVNYTDSYETAKTILRIRMEAYIERLKESIAAEQDIIKDDEALLKVAESYILTLA